MPAPMTSDISPRLPADDPAVSRYLRSLRQGTSPCRADGDSETQTANYRRGHERNALLNARLRRLLDSCAVSPALRLPYRNFCLHLDKLCRRYSGKTLRRLAALALDRSAASGLDPAILKAIARQLLGLNPG